MVAPFHFPFVFYYSRILLRAFNLMPHCQRPTVANCHFLFHAIFHRMIFCAFDDSAFYSYWLLCSYACAYTSPMAHATHRRIVNSATYHWHPLHSIALNVFCFRSFYAAPSPPNSERFLTFASGCVRTRRQSNGKCSIHAPHSQFYSVSRQSTQSVQLSLTKSSAFSPGLTVVS